MWVGKRHGGIGTRRSGDRLSGSHHDENKCGSLQCFCSSLLGALRFQTRKGAMWRHGLLLIKTRGNMPACSTSWGSNRAQMVLCSGPSSCAAPNNTDPPRFHSPNKQKKHTGESNPLRQTCNLQCFRHSFAEQCRALLPRGLFWLLPGRCAFSQPRSPAQATSLPRGSSQRLLTTKCEGRWTTSMMRYASHFREVEVGCDRVPVYLPLFETLLVFGLDTHT